MKVHTIPRKTRKLIDTVYSKTEKVRANEQMTEEQQDGYIKACFEVLEEIFNLYGRKYDKQRTTKEDK